MTSASTYSETGQSTGQERDSQAGTVLSQSAVKDHRALRDLADPAELESVLASHPLINTADFIAPNTLNTSKQ